MHMRGQYLFDLGVQAYPVTHMNEVGLLRTDTFDLRQRFLQPFVRRMFPLLKGSEDQ